MAKEIDKLSEEELFTSIPLNARLENYQVKALLDLKLEQRKVVTKKTIEASTTADTRLKINNSGQLDILFTKRVSFKGDAKK